MTTATEYTYTDEQISAWLRGLLTIAWADGNFDRHEQELITSLTRDQLAPKTDLGSLQTITPQDLATALGQDSATRENFLRTAVMMSIADGIYTQEEAAIVNNFREALGLEIEALKCLEHTLCDYTEEGEEKVKVIKPVEPTQPSGDVLKPMRDWLDGIEVEDPRVARFVCKMIPAQCPFERDVKLFGHKIVHIPPMCKINPLYEQLVGLRFRSLSYLADDCQEDISQYV